MELKMSYVLVRTRLQGINDGDLWHIQCEETWLATPNITAQVAMHFMVILREKKEMR
jgi:hypothetical protein